MQVPFLQGLAKVNIDKDQAICYILE